MASGASSTPYSSPIFVQTLAGQMQDCEFPEVPADSALKVTSKTTLSFAARGAGLCCSTARANFSSGAHYFEVSIDQAQHGGNNVWVGVTETPNAGSEQYSSLTGWGIQNFRVVKDMINNVTRTYGYHFGSGSKIGVFIDVHRERIVITLSVLFLISRNFFSRKKAWGMPSYIISTWGTRLFLPLSE